jgi:predicted PurR-regulated permease PerM
MDNSSKILQISAGSIVKTIIIGLIFYTAYLLRGLLLIILMAVVIASSVEVGAKLLVKKGVPRLLAVILIYLCIGVILVGTIYFILLPLLSESTQVLNTLPNYLSLESSQTSTFLSNQPFVSNFSNTLNLSDIVAQINVIISNLTSGTFNTVAGVFGGILNSLLIVVLSFYLSVKEDGIHNFLKIVTPLKHEEYVLDLWKRAQHKIGLWMQGQLILAVIIGLLVFLGLTLMNIPNALLLAFLAAVFEIIPLFGPILAAIPAVALSFVDGGISAVFLVTGLYLIIHQFENHLIYPLVVKKVTGVSPVVSIVALVAGFELAGFLGLVLSVPVATVLIEFFDDLERDKITKMEKANS